jgi:hypothetical protein
MQTVSAQFKLPKNILQPTSASSAGANEYTTKLLDNISFSHFTELLKISSKEKREFYEIQCIKGIWTVRELKRQINSLTFERTAASKNKGKTINIFTTAEEIQLASSLIKTPFVF